MHVSFATFSLRRSQDSNVKKLKVITSGCISQTELMSFIYNLTEKLSVMKGFISLEVATLAHLNSCCTSGVYGFFCHVKHILCNFYKHHIKKDHVPTPMKF